jgi:sialate O-acetylesterase
MKKQLSLTALILALWLQSGFASNLEMVVNLKGQWKFNIGDDPAWAQKDYNDSNWDEVKAPSSWENQGYVGYDGYAWYRKKISLPTTSKNNSLYLNLGNIDDVCEVYINGKRVGQSGVFPPAFVTAYNAPVNIYLADEDLNFGGENTIAIRVYDDYADGGMVNGNIQVSNDLNSKLLSLDLSGKWKLAFKNASDQPREWHTVNVPSTWESQGFPNVDGFAYYGKSFTLPTQLANEQLYLVLGKIDDKDKVYLNKKLIGTIDDMQNTPLDAKYRGDWQTRRAYKIPKEVLKPGQRNVIAVLVYDEGGNGGIHEGPIGLMTEENFRIYEKANEEEYYYGMPGLIEFLIEVFN